MDIVAEATGGETHYTPTAADFGNDGSFGNKAVQSSAPQATPKMTAPQPVP